MKKLLVRFERETTIKDDLCYTDGRFNLNTSGISCSNCRVHLVTDRFLSRDFQQNVMNDTRDFPMGTYPYVLIVDTALCNLRCRSCYSWKYWEPEKSAAAVLVDPETLADQFKCKIEKLHDGKLLSLKKRFNDKSKRPFSRLRISGGEPLYEPDGNSIKFWIKFFDKLDVRIGALLKGRLINMVHEEEWVEMTKEERIRLFPVFLKSDNGKIRIRFDTNGKLFKDELFVREFIGNIYALQLKNIKIDLTFSLKGTTRSEVDWFVRRSSQFDTSDANREENLEKHPQWICIENIVNAIKTFEQEESLHSHANSTIGATYYNPCGEVSLTVERGIMHNEKENLFINTKTSLDWRKFEKKLANKGINLSETENCIYLGQYPKGVAWRYINKGNYELRFFCAHHGKSPFLTYSRSPKSQFNSIEHRQIGTYGDPNLGHLTSQIYELNKKRGTKCTHSEKECDYWIELTPIKASNT